MEALIKTLKDLSSDLSELFIRLKTILMVNTEAYNEVLTQEKRYNNNETASLGGRISYEEAEIVRNNVLMATLRLIDQLQSGDLKEKPGQQLHHAHIYACDRIAQNDKFKEATLLKRDDKSHFFFLFGYYLERHTSLFDRFVLDLQGGLTSKVGTSGTKVIDVKMPITFSQNMEVFKIQFLKEFLEKFEIKVNQQEPLLDKNVRWLCENSSPIQKLGSHDYVCVFISMTEWDWDAQVTPELTRWFITHFCKSSLGEEHPTFLFFFSVSYESDDSPVEQEVRTSIEQSEHIIGLPELEKVHMRDIAQWFNRYSFIRPTSRELVELRNQLFGGAREHHMDDVEKSLRKIIDDFNEQYI